MNEARTKLAEAMKYERKSISVRSLLDGDVKVQELRWFNPSGRLAQLPDPFTDANDDCAVLEWMRPDDDEMISVEEWDLWRAFKDYFIEMRADSHTWNYQIGDYARAACKVLDID